MSEAPKKKKKSKPEPKGKGLPIVAIAISVVVFGVLGYLVLQASKDFSAKQAATSAESAWRSALRAKSDKDLDLTKSELEKIPVTGSPTKTTAAGGQTDPKVKAVDTYSWKGTFRTYSISIGYGLGNDPPVEFIDPIK